MRALFFLIVAIPLCGLAQSPSPAPADLTTVSGRTYKHARAFRVEPDGITYMYDGGMSKIDFTDLPEAIQKQYGYDPKKAASFASQDAAEQQANYVAGQRSTAQAATQQQGKEHDAKMAKALELMKQAGFQATLQVRQGLENGALGSITTTTGSAARNLLESDTRRTSSEGEGFVYGVQAADGEAWSGMLYPCGNYRYEAVNGAARSIHAYATTPEEALSRLKR